MTARSEGPTLVRVGPSGLFGLLGMRNPDLTVGAIPLRRFAPPTCDSLVVFGREHLTITPSIAPRFPQASRLLM